MRARITRWDAPRKAYAVSRAHAGADNSIASRIHHDNGRSRPRGRG